MDVIGIQNLELNVVMSDLINLVESFSSASRIRTYSEYCSSTDIVCSTLSRISGFMISELLKLSTKKPTSGFTLKAS